MQSQYLILISILGWGVGSIFYKIANNNMHPLMVSSTATVVFLILLSVAFLFLKFNHEVNATGLAAAIVGGLCMCAASLGYFFALRQGNAGITTALTSLYPALTLVLSMIFLKETINFKQGIGMVLAAASFLLLSMK
jgi:transporter family protein